MLDMIKAQDIQGIENFCIIRIIIIFICWIFIFIAALIDFNSALQKERALGHKIESNKFRNTFKKLSDYYKVMLFGLMIDILGSLFTFYFLPFMTLICTLAVIGVEGSSVLENNKEKKSEAAKVPELLKEIVRCSTTDQGIDVVKKIVSIFSAASGTKIPIDTILNLLKSQDEKKDNTEK